MIATTLAEVVSAHGPSSEKQLSSFLDSCSSCYLHYKQLQERRNEMVDQMKQSNKEIENTMCEVLKEENSQ